MASNQTPKVAFKDQMREASIPVAEAFAVGESLLRDEALEQQRLEEEQARLDEQQARLEEQRQLHQERQARLQAEQARLRAEQARLEAERRLVALQHGNSFPAANNPGMTPVATNTATEREEETRKSYVKHWILAGAALLLVASAAVGGICGSGNCSSGVPPSPRPVAPPTPQPTSAAFRSELIASYINSITLSGRTLSYPNGNAFPEEEALNWLIEDDVRTSATDERTLRQRFALATLWFANGPFDSDHLDSWLTSREECDWEIIFDCVGGEVTNVGLYSDGLNGQLPSDLALLTAVTTWQLFDNELIGSIPTELGLLTALTWWDISTNQLTGSIPTEFGLLTAMTTLDLAFNQLTGTIPTELTRMTALTRFWIWNNNVSGDMPFCDGATRPTRFARLEADCNEVSCPCCTACCPDGGFGGIPSGTTSCDA